MRSNYKYDEVDELIDNLTRPLYVLRMARAKLEYNYSQVALDSPQVVRMLKSAQTSMQKAKQEIREIVENYTVKAH